MSAPILVVGGTGKLGRLVVARLLAEGQGVRVISRNAEAARSVLGPDVEVFAGDLADIAALAPAFDGLERAFLLTPISHDLAQLQIGFVRAAAATGLERIVKISGSDWTITIPGASRAGAQHEQVEQELSRLPLRAVSIRPNAWMQVSLPALVTVAASGEPLPARSGHAKVSYIDARDIADVAVNQLLAADIAPTPLVITGGESLGIGDIATRLSGLLGRQVLIEDNPPPAPFPPQFDAYEKAAVGEFLAQIRAGRAAATTDTVQHLLGRKPRTVLGFLAESLGKATPSA